MYSIRRWLYRPKKTDKSLLACFFFADEELNSVAAELDSFDGRKDPDRCTVLVNKLRNCQDKVLLTIQSIMDDVIPYQRAPRDFRVKYPDDVIQESLLGQLWFGAECLAAGSCIMHREGESASMRPLARALTRTLDNLRNSLRDQCLRSGPHYHPKIRETLVMFDQLLAEFELSYVSAMVPVKSAKEFETMQDIVVLFSETVERALKRGLISRDMIDSCDPLLMFTIPRLAILSGLILYQEGPLYPEKEPESMSEMFRPFQTLLCKIKQLLFTLTPQEFTALERALCTSGETPPTTPPIDQSENQLNAPLSAHAQISISTSQTLVSNMIAGSGEEVVIGSLNAVMTHLPESTNEEPRSSHVTLKDEWAVRELENVIDDDDIDAQSPSEVFEDAREFLSPDVSLCDFEYDNKDTDQSASVLDQSDLPISTNHFRDPAGQPSPEVVKNNKIVDYDELSSHSVASSDGDSACDTISTSSSYSSSCNDDEEVLLAIKAAQMANRKGIRSKFKSSEELNHKLFVCISGVADQLQTNFASDLRNILRTVFTMHSSDSLDQSVPSKPVTSSEEGRVRFQIRHGRERLRAPPRWVPDDERSTCTGCSTLFTFVRRRHHCRNCGQIFCQQCSSATMSLPQFGHRLPVRVCLTCSNGRTQ